MRKTYTSLGLCALMATTNSCSSISRTPFSKLSSPYAPAFHSEQTSDERIRLSLEHRFQVTPEQMTSIAVLPEDCRTPKECTPAEIQQIIALASAPFQDVQGAITTPAQAALYCERILVHGGVSIDKDRFGIDWWMSGEQTHANLKCDCDDAAVVAASLLKDDGYPPYVLVVRGLEKKSFMMPPGKIGVAEVPFAHALFLYKTEKGMFGSVGINRFDRRIPSTDSFDVFITSLSKDMACEIGSCVIYDVGLVHPDYDTNLLNNSPEQER